jgi:arsenate reductase (thioredoxin)
VRRSHEAASLIPLHRQLGSESNGGRLVAASGNNRYDVCSAGTQPVGLNPGSVEAMAEVGIDIAHHRSKHVTEYATQPIDYVITVCDRAKESCPRWSGATHLLHWSLDDPSAVTESAEQRGQVFRRVRDEIAASIREFLVSTTVRYDEYIT